MNRGKYIFRTFLLVVRDNGGALHRQLFVTLDDVELVMGSALGHIRDDSIGFSLRLSGFLLVFRATFYRHMPLVLSLALALNKFLPNLTGLPVADFGEFVVIEAAVIVSGLTKTSRKLRLNPRQTTNIFHPFLVCFNMLQNILLLFHLSIQSFVILRCDPTDVKFNVFDRSNYHGSIIHLELVVETQRIKTHPFSDIGDLKESMGKISVRTTINGLLFTPLISLLGF